MELFKILLILHIAAGSLGLISGCLVMCLRKGNRLHKSLGRVFAISMLLSSVVALILTSIHPNTMLSIIAFFTIYMVISAYLALHAGTKGRYYPFLIGLGYTLGLLFFAMGLYGLFKGNSFGIVLQVFGFICGRFAHADRKFHKSGKKRDVTLHLQRMSGAFIASATAFLVVNAKHFGDILPAFVFWLLPTVIITPLIFRWTARFRK